MLICLPPSEGKWQPTQGRPLDLAALSFGELSTARTRMIDTLIEVSGGPEALSTLKLGESLADEAHANTLLWQLPTARADRVYTGVLYDAWGPASLSERGKRRAAASIVIFSALFGLLRPADRIPAYRLNGAVRLPGIGTPTAFWRGALDASLDARGLVIDCRSSTYAGMWTVPSALAVRVFTERAGRRTPVSHTAKHARGLVTRALCEAASTPRTSEQAAEAVADWFAENPMRTASGAEVTVGIEMGQRSLDVITR